MQLIETNIESRDLNTFLMSVLRQTSTAQIRGSQEYTLHYSALPRINFNKDLERPNSQDFVSGTGLAAMKE
jgi:hypothetical protein